jgi:hypothetical protein
MGKTFCVAVIRPDRGHAPRPSLFQSTRRQMMKMFSTALLSLGLAATPALAQTTGADKKKTDDRQAAVTAAARTTAPAAATGTVRNWAEIDTNRDNLVSPEEMEKYLQAQWAAQKK